MTSDKFVFSTLCEVCEGTYVAYPMGGAPPLPWFTYRRLNGGEVFADDTNYSLLPRYRVELLFKEKDPELVAAFEAALSRLGTWKLYDADWLDSENCIAHDYRLTVNLARLRERSENG